MEVETLICYQTTPLTWGLLKEHFDEVTVHFTAWNLPPYIIMKARVYTQSVRAEKALQSREESESSLPEITPAVANLFS